MAKFFLTNHQVWYQTAKERINASDYKLAFDYAKSGVYALTTHKLKIPNENAYEASNGDFVIATGTAIYKESLNYEQLYKDWNGDINSVRGNTIGQYAYIVNKGRKISIFGDRAAAYDIYYYIGQDGDWFVSNNLYDMATIIRERLYLNELAIVEYASTFNIFSNETLFQNIYRLDGLKYLKIEGKNATLCDINNCPQFCVDKKQSVEKASKQLAAILKNKARVIAQVFGPPTILMTGGLDSRMLLAAFLSCGVKPNLLNGRSNTFLASPIPEDVIVIKQLASKYSLNLDIVNWDTRNSESYWDFYLNRYGFLSRHWGASKPIYDTFENIETSTAMVGLGGEMYRSKEFPTPEKDAPYTLDDMIEAYAQFIYGTNRETFKNYSAYREYIRNKFDAIAQKYHLNPNSISADDIIYFNYEFNKVGDTVPPNLQNHIRFAPLLLLEADCMDCAMLTDRELDGARLMLMTMECLKQDMLDVNFCTRCKMYEIDKHTMTLKPMSMSLKDVHRSKFELLLKKIYTQSGVLLKPLRNLYKVIENELRPTQQINLDISTESYPSYISYDMKFVDPRPEFYYRYLNNAFKHLGYKEIKNY